MHSELANAVDRYASITLGLSEAELDLPWAWGDYDSEGIRFSMFRTFEELRTLAVQLDSRRREDGPPMTEAQQILAGFHRAYRWLKIVLLGLAPEIFDRIPKEGEWTIRQALSHIFNAQTNFSVVISYGLRRRTDTILPVSPPDEFWDAKIGMTESEFEAFLSGPAQAILAALEDLHGRVLAEFAAISREDLNFETKFWENTLMPQRFRMFRFESHMRQHTVQIEKTLVQLGLRPTEARQLLFLIFDALAEVENTTLGAPDFGGPAMADLAEIIEARNKELENIIEADTEKNNRD